MSKKVNLKKHHYYGGAAILVAAALAFYLGIFPTQVESGGPGRAPVLTNLSAMNVTQTSADVMWTTDIPSTDNVCWVAYFTTRKKDQKLLQWQCAVPASADGVTKVARVTGLTPGLEYTYFVTAISAANEHKDTNSDFLKFTTLP